MAIPTLLQTKISNLATSDAQLLQQAIALAQLSGEDRATPFGISCFEQGLCIAQILAELNLDATTLAAAILFSSVEYAGLSLEDVREHFGPKVVKLIQGAEQMREISDLYQSTVGRAQYQHNIDKIRKMILAMVDDIRVVIIKLAERLTALRYAKIFNEELRKQLAAETMAIYAPLTHRLGIAQIKWELEDLAFRYLEPEKYQEIVAALEQHFPERNQYIKEVIAEVQHLLQQADVKFSQVSGRAKHVYSVYRKMQRKKIGLEGLYDVTAIRIFAPTVADCYAILSQIHATWRYIPEEFDDYIAAPKPNGYRSVHTAVIGPKNRVVEIQIRTPEMHSLAELGVAAHWIYKEGKGQTADYEAKISWLRQVVDWQEEVIKSEETLSTIRQLFNDRIYVFTPEGDILDLPQGATPLDFAYHLHSDVGHKCCGAKVNGSIVPLTHVLQTGERVEILTAKNGHPSRDWLNPNLGFLKTSRARAKVFNWYKKQDQEHNIVLGQELLAKEIQRLGLKKLDIETAAAKLNFKTTADFLAAVGGGDLKLANILNILKIELEPKPVEVVVPKVQVSAPKTERISSDINIHGIGNLLMYLANCCKPIPSDQIVGYITQGQGIAIHRADCVNALHAKKIHPEKFVEVSWGSKIEKHYSVDLIITAFDRQGLVRDITNVLADENIMVAGLDLGIDKKENVATIKMTIEISGIQPLSRILTLISKLPNIIEVSRRG